MPIIFFKFNLDYSPLHKFQDNLASLDYTIKYIAMSRDLCIIPLNYMIQVLGTSPRK